MKYYVDVPEPTSIGTDNERWTHLDTFDSKEQAIEFIREHIDSTVDPDGKICLLSVTEE